MSCRLPAAGKREAGTLGSGRAGGGQETRSDTSLLSSFCLLPVARLNLEPEGKGAQVTQPKNLGRSENDPEGRRGKVRHTH